MDSAASPGDSPLTNNDREVNGDPFLLQYQPSELRIASEFLTTWLPFLARDLCPHCSETLSSRIRSLDPPTGDTIMDAKVSVVKSNDNYAADGDDTNSLSSWKDAVEPSTSRGPVLGRPRKSWADMAAQEDELAAAEDDDDEERESKRVVNLDSATGEIGVSSSSSGSREVVGEKPNLSRDQREYLRFMNIKRKKDFNSLERVKGKFVNVVDGLELHKGIFSAAEQKRIVKFVYELQEMGRKGELNERTYMAPQKWMKGKGRVTIQFGCCYNYATDRNGNPPGILQRETVDPIPSLFKVIIRRLVRWHVLPPTCIPDSCIVNIYDEGDCIPPHVDNHDFVRPFCTVSFLSECDIVFGTNLKVISAGEFKGSIAIPLPVGSVLVLNGNSADVAKHCVPSVPTKRISITFRKMDETKRPISFVPEPDLQVIHPLSYEADKTKRTGSPKSEDHMRREFHGKEGRKEGRVLLDHDYQSEPRYSNRGCRGSASGPRIKVNLDS